MGKTFSKKLKGFGVNVIAYDKYKTGFSNENVKEVTLEELFKQTDVLSIHTPLTPETIKMVDADLVHQIKKGKVLGACLDVLEYESSSFEFLDSNNIPEPLSYLLTSNKAIVTPHIAGWTHEAKYKMGKVLIDKIVGGMF